MNWYTSGGPEAENNPPSRPDSRPKAPNEAFEERLRSGSARRSTMMAQAITTIAQQQAQHHHDVGIEPGQQQHAAGHAEQRAAVVARSIGHSSDLWVPRSAMAALASDSTVATFATSGSGASSNRPASPAGSAPSRNP